MVDSVSVRYGGVVAVDAVSFSAEPGRVTGIVGPNGAGKTSLIDALTGMTRNQGSILLDDLDVSALSTHQRCRRGMTRTFQANDLFDDLTVLENVEIADTKSTKLALGGTLFGRRSPSEQRASQTLSLLGIVNLSSSLPAEISYGQRKLVGIARAIVSRPKVVCLDEPAAGLDSMQTGDLADRIKEIAADGAAVLLVDHDMDLVLSVSHQVVVLDFGKVIFTGTPVAMRADATVRAAYLGEDEPTMLNAADQKMEVSRR